MWLAALWASLCCLVPMAQAQTFTQGVDVSGTTATIWFKPGFSSAWVDVHYQQNGGTQQNLRSTYNAAAARFEQKVLNAVAPGDVLSYFFTYEQGGLAHDTARFTFTVGSGGGGGGGGGGGTFSFTNGVDLAGSTATIWFKPSQTIAFVDVHYLVNGTSQQNIRMPFNSTLARYQQNVLSAVSTGQVIDYWFTYSLTGATTVDTTHFSYTVGSGGGGGGAVATPTFSPAPGTYTTAQTVAIATATSGATIRYTTDGSTPTASSPTYTGPFSVASTKTIKAFAQKSGMTDSAVASGTYTVNTGGTWNGLTTFNIVNQTNGKWADSQVYWAIIGKDWNTGNFVHVDASGNLVPMALSDNGALQKNGQNYSNYFFSLAQKKTVTIPAINSARLMLSVGSPMYIQVNIDGAGHIAYAGANIENPTDPNIDVTFDFGEFAILPKGNAQQGIFINTTRVDQFGFPLKLRMQGLGGYDQTVGEPLTESRDTLFSKFQAEVPAPFRSLAQAPYAPYRIIAPAHASFQTGQANGTYLDAYITQIWNQYTNQDLVINLNNGWPTFTGRVSGNVFRFTDGQGTYFINGKPTTSMVLLGNGLLDDPNGVPGGLPHDKQLQLQAQMCAALNRHVAENTANWYNQPAHYPAGSLANWYAKFWHDHSINKLAYGFAYDDVGFFSPSLHSDAPTTVTYTVGW